MLKDDKRADDLAENINIQSIITGLADDLAGLRAGRISVQQARASADLGRQVFSGIRVMLTARKVLETEALPVKALEAAKNAHKS